MVSRLFGRGKKTQPPQEPQPSVSTPVEPEEEGFVVLGSGSNSNPKTDPQIYPSLSGFPQPAVPASLPNGTAIATSHYLDGVPFALSSQCSLGAEQFDASLARVDSLSERLRNVNWNAIDYDFNIEKSVLQDIGITDTLRRLHAS